MVRRKASDLSTTKLIAIVQVRAEAMGICRPRGFPNTRRKCFATIKIKIKKKKELRHNWSLLVTTPSAAKGGITSSTDVIGTSSSSLL